MIGYVDSLINAVIDKLSNIPGFSPIEHVGQYYGGKLGEGFAEGIAAAAGQVGRAASGLAGAALDGMHGGATVNGGVTFHINGARDPRLVANEVWLTFSRELALREGA